MLQCVFAGAAVHERACVIPDERERECVCVRKRERERLRFTNPGQAAPAREATVFTDLGRALEVGASTIGLAWWLGGAWRGRCSGTPQAAADPESCCPRSWRVKAGLVSRLGSSS